MSASARAASCRAPSAISVMKALTRGTTCDRGQAACDKLHGGQLARPQPRRHLADRRQMRHVSVPRFCRVRRRRRRRCDSSASRRAAVDAAGPRAAARAPEAARLRVSFAAASQSDDPCIRSSACHAADRDRVGRGARPARRTGSRRTSRPARRRTDRSEPAAPFGKIARARHRGCCGCGRRPRHTKARLPSPQPAERSATNEAGPDVVGAAVRERVVSGGRAHRSRRGCPAALDAAADPSVAPTLMPNG